MVPPGMFSWVQPRVESTFSGLPTCDLSRRHGRQPNHNNLKPRKLAAVPQNSVKCSCRRCLYATQRTQSATAFPARARELSTAEEPSTSRRSGSQDRPQPSYPESLPPSYPSSPVSERRGFWGQAPPHYDAVFGDPSDGSRTSAPQVAEPNITSHPLNIRQGAPPSYSSAMSSPRSCQRQESSPISSPRSQTSKPE